MSDECLMKQETVFPFYIDCQAVMRKFTLAGKSVLAGSIELRTYVPPELPDAVIEERRKMSEGIHQTNSILQ